MKKILYIDMDGVLVDYQIGIDKLTDQQKIDFKNRLYLVPGIFSLLEPLPGAIEAYKMLSNKYDTYILSSPPWDNVSAWGDKLEWVKKYLGGYAKKRLILSHHKNLNVGDYLIDDRTENGAGQFRGKHIHFNSEEFPDWSCVCEYLLRDNSVT